MIDPDTAPPPLVRSVCHPSDFSEGSETAFAHALAIALLGPSELTVFHTDAGNGGDPGWRRYPAIRETLERWGRLPKGSPRSAVFRELGIRAQKVGGRDADPTRAVVDYLEQEPADLVVLATRGGRGMPAWLDASVAGKVARRSRTRTLFVPKGADGFVSFETGEISLRRVLIAVDDEPRPHAAIEFACRAARALGSIEIRLLHVGDASAFPGVDVGSDPAWQISRVNREGDVVDAICAEASEFGADLIAMTTAGRHGFLDALYGSTTEQVLRRATCPVLAVPAGDQAP